MVKIRGWLSPTQPGIEIRTPEIGASDAAHTLMSGVDFIGEIVPTRPDGPHRRDRWRFFKRIKQRALMFAIVVPVRERARRYKSRAARLEAQSPTKEKLRALRNEFCVNSVAWIAPGKFKTLR